MTVMEALAAGAPMRQDGWIQGLYVRWNEASLRWEYRQDEQPWEMLPQEQQCLTRRSLLATDWEIAENA
jgi:hypothetical protein